LVKVASAAVADHCKDCLDIGTLAGREKVGGLLHAQVADVLSKSLTAAVLKEPP
jgi:hypothetical protein